MTSLANQNSSDQTQLLSKLSELKGNLLKNSPPNEASALDLANVADELFRRAPLAFLQRTPTVRLVELTRDCAGFLARHRATKRQLSVEAMNPERVDSRSSERSDVSVIKVAISDRSFVVDSLQEVLRESDLRIEILLHPIFRFPSTTSTTTESVSLAYFEIERLEDDTKLSELAELFRHTLEDVILVTEAFPSLRARLCDVCGTLADAKSLVPEIEKREIGALAEWLVDGGFVFLGVREWTGDTDSGQLTLVTNADQGLFCSTNPAYNSKFVELELDAKHLLQNTKHFVHFSKSLFVSSVHRHTRLDLIITRTPLSGKENRITLFAGLFTSRAIAQEASSVPMIRRKLERMLELEEVLPNSHDYKEIVAIIDGMPKFELFSTPVDLLRHEINLIMSMQRRADCQVSVRHDGLQRFTLVLVVIPRDRFAPGVRLRIQRTVEELLQMSKGSAEFKLAVSDDPLARIYFTFPNPTYALHAVDEQALASSISEIIFTWDDKILASLKSRQLRELREKFKSFYSTALSAEYKAATSTEVAITDLAILEQLDAEDSIEITLEPCVRQTQNDGQVLELRIFKRGTSLTLSALLPMLENAGLEILRESVFPVSQPNNGRLENWATIYSFEVRAESTRSSGGPAEGAATTLDEGLVREFFIPGLKAIISGLAESDRLNSLLLNPGLSLEHLAILRAVQRYLWQIKGASSPTALTTALTRNPLFAKFLIDYFIAKFRPSSETAPGKQAERERQNALAELKEDFLSALRDVSDIDDDRALRVAFNVIESTLRTNYYREKRGSALCFKIDCQLITSMPAPRPRYEIFISGPMFDGVHLRGGKVARGGLRWSERPDDYRTEVLGLMKTQMVKNAIIVPVGAKGGFVVKGKASPESVRECYCGYIRALLEVTDNRVGDTIVHPPGVIFYDQADPYLVVAADKGTATFSDVANGIATKEFNFWLGDAFASGGSKGYSHKDLAITARGAWETAIQHFREQGIDINQQTFTVVGIGDMSGDVFGNGLLRSKNAKLIAAFNHKHIFVDPSPDPARSYAERERLFNLPRSEWSDYDSKLLSHGGGIYLRKEKEISLSAEARAALGVSEAKLSGQELVKAILRAPVDLLWNGGIGTYVKATSETHLQVGDRSNDDVRIDAPEVRAKIIAEGGNLGCTQLGRIEYCQHGGRCNTDAVDNSGGVNMSDLEVNLKILLQAPLANGEITEEQRIQILRDNADEVGEKVVERNRAQAVVLSLGQMRSRKTVDTYRGLIHRLSRRVSLDRKVENLPDEETLAKRASQKLGLMRPELAVLLAYEKMATFDTVMKSSLPEDEFAGQFLFGYFPQPLVERFRSHIITHPLRREIIATQIANVLVERMGSTFVYRTSEETGASEAEVVAAFLAADAILGATDISKQLDVINTAGASAIHLRALQLISRALDGMTRWILQHRLSKVSLREFVEVYHRPFAQLLEVTRDILTESEARHFDEAVERYRNAGCPTALAHLVAATVYATPYMDIVQVSSIMKKDPVKIAALYSALANEFALTPLLEKVISIETQDRWETLAHRNLTQQLRSSIGELCRSIISETGEDSVNAFALYLDRRAETVERVKITLREFATRSMTLPALLVVCNQLDALSRPVHVMKAEK